MALDEPGASGSCRGKEEMQVRTEEVQGMMTSVPNARRRQAVRDICLRIISARLREKREREISTKLLLPPARPLAHFRAIGSRSCVRCEQPWLRPRYERQ
jgi:hypothetical protein